MIKLTLYTHDGELCFETQAEVMGDCILHLNEFLRETGVRFKWTLSSLELQAAVRDKLDDSYVTLTIS